MQKFDLYANKNSKYLFCKFSDHIEAFDKVNVFFYGSDFVVVVAVAIAIVLYFEYVDFVVFAAVAVHTLFVYCVLCSTVVEIVVVADDVVVVDAVVLAG